MSAALHVLWLDSTVMGMGRGAGNTATEMLLLQMDRDYESLRPILPDFADLKAKYRWGPSLDYYLAAINGIHPMEVQCK
jgi:4-hydroxy 2-oxovalerate aldolase